jgi:arylsulfatase A-like enzyme
MKTRQLLPVLIAGAALSASAARKPNVIVIYTDDHGYADMSIQGQLDDVKTPNIDQLARDGVLCNDGYSTAPQCCPSRAGVMTGRHQSRFGMQQNGMGPLPLEEVTLADRMKAAGYRTGMIGKWHLEPFWIDSAWVKKELGVENATEKTNLPFEKILPYYPQNRGFDEFFKGELNRYWINYGLDGKDRNPEGEWQTVDGYRLEIQTDAALAFIERNKKNPFFLYLAYFAPHVPLEATQKYLDRFPGEMPERRRYALAMISAMDDGIGLIREQLEKLGLEKDTLIFFIADNGAPLKIDMEDIPISFPGGAWDGSRNDPWVGEKGMVMEGGIHVPYVFAWPGTVPAGQVCNDPVSTLDVSPTCLAAAGQSIPEELDGINLLPHFSKVRKPFAERDLFWRFWDQGAVRRGDWKYTVLTDGREMLYNLSTEEHENNNLISQYPEKAGLLRKAWEKWADELTPAGFRSCPLNDQEQKWYEHYLNEPAVIMVPVPAGPLPALYAAMDADGNQMLSEAEYVDGRTAHEKPLLMKKLNLTEGQYQLRREGYRGSYRSNFKKRDANSDNVLNADELK